ncbi:MAG: glutaminyl-peptide cyclotransferase [Thermoplasmata archaeon]|nr:glutaminyl-peptide cyclotransferase [Thermoplasmata archaeon]
MFIVVVAILIVILIIGWAFLIDTPSTKKTEETPPPDETPISAYNYTYNITNIYPHDKDAFTQGLVFENGVLYEGTGLWGQSSLRKVQLETGEIDQIHKLSSKYFGEGITIYKDKIIQLTWQSNVGFVYDKTNFELLQEFTYPTEGWGITHDGEQLIMSDGSHTLYFLNPETFEQIGTINVSDNNRSVSLLNELEYINGEIYANIWYNDSIIKIDPETGNVTGRIDLTGLINPEDYNHTVNVLNGIAYDAENKRLFVTGKQWPKLFEIELVPLE